VSRGRRASARTAAASDGLPAPCGEAGAAGGSLSLEFALTVPLLFVLVMVVFNAAMLGRDALLVQSAAREGARAAAVTDERAAVTLAADRALGGRPASVAVVEDGDLVRVTVTMTSRVAGLGVELTASATARAEPVRER